MRRNFEIWSDNLVEADWFASLDGRLEHANVQIIGKRGDNHQIIDDLVQYDRPDIILLEDDSPVLVLEKTREVPTGHNVGQRVARLIRAAEFSIPTFFFLPFDARKHGRYSSMCTINTRLFRAMLRAGEIHDCPVLPVNWPCDSDGELVIDGTENDLIGKLVRCVIDGDYRESSSSVSAHFAATIAEMERREKQYPPYRDLPKSAKFVNTKGFLGGLGFLSQIGASKLLERDKSLVYKMNMTPDKCKRQDPYTGMQFIYDYGWLRSGSSPSQRDSNLILHVPLVDLQTWMAQNPEDYQTKSCNWYLIADAIVLSDGLIHLNNWPIHHEP